MTPIGLFPIPALSDLVQRARRAFRTYMPGTDAWLWPNNIYVVAKMLGGLLAEAFGFFDYIQHMIFVSTAPDLETLILHGNEFGLALRPAQPARGPVTVTTSDTLAVADGAIFQRGDGIRYVSLVAVNLASPGSVDVDCVATTDGKTTIAEADTALDIVSGVTGTATAVVGTAGITNGTDVEDIETFRARILFRKRNPPMGGSASDYVQWASEVSGVSAQIGGIPDVYVERLWSGCGSVRVFPLMYDLYANGVPLSGDVTRVADYIAPLAPADASVTVAAPTAQPIDVQISELDPNTTATQQAVIAELTAMFRRKARVAGNDPGAANMPYLATPYTFAVDWIWGAAGAAAGVNRLKVVSPADDVSVTTGRLPTLGNVTFV